MNEILSEINRIVVAVSSKHITDNEAKEWLDDVLLVHGTKNVLESCSAKHYEEILKARNV